MAGSGGCRGSKRMAPGAVEASGSFVGGGVTGGGVMRGSPTSACLCASAGSTLGLCEVCGAQELQACLLGRRGATASDGTSCGFWGHLA